MCDPATVDVLALGSFSDATQLKTILFVLHQPRNPSEVHPLLFDRAVLLQQFDNVNIFLRNLLTVYGTFNKNP
jgi:hypothetical protein